MHPNPAFRGEPEARSLAFARKRAFGTLVRSAEPMPLLAHVPFLLDADGRTAELHLVRSNPIARGEDGAAVIAVTGPDGYVSPDWYRVPDQVPTWNYVAVHLRGRLERRPHGEMRELLDRLSAEMEARLLPKTPWRTEKMDADVLTRMMRQIVPFRFHVEDVQGTWKLTQNKPDAVRLRAADALEAAGLTAGAAALAELMRDVR